MRERTKPWRVAIVGAGNTAREHLRAFSDVPGVLIAGIHSRTRSRAEDLARVFGVPLVADSIVELYERTLAAIVVVAVNELSANSVARACLEHPWIPLLEKPPGYNLADALDIRSAAGDRPVLVAMNRRAYGVTRAVQQALSDTQQPRFVSVQDQQSQQRAAELGEPELVVRNYMYANSIHLVDYLRVFCRGQVEEVERVIPWNPDCPGMVVAKVRFSSGDIGLYQAMWHAPGPWAVAVTVPGRRWELRPLETATIETSDAPLEPLAQNEWDHRFKPGYRAQAEAAIEFAAGRPAEVATLDDAIETMRLISSIYCER